MKKLFISLGITLALFAGAVTSQAQETLVVDGSKSYLWQLNKGTDYVIPGTDDTWYCQPGFFTHKNGETWTFNANGNADIAYAIKLDLDRKYVDVVQLNATEGEGVDVAPTANYDNNKALYVNGNQNIGFPSYESNAINWRGDADVPVPMIADGVYQLVLVGGQQINPTSINFKFFKGKNWGGDFGEQFIYMLDNEYLRINGQNPEDTGDKGNILGKNGDFGDLDTLVVTIDMNTLTNGLGTVTVTKKTYTPSANPQLNGTDLTKFSNFYYSNITLAPNQELTFSNLDAVGVDWTQTYVDAFAATKGEAGKLTFNAVAGNYCVALVPSLNYVKIFPGTMENPGTFESDKALWIIGGDIGQPSIEANKVNWSPSIMTCVPMMQVADNVYKIALTVGKEIASGVNIKLFGQPGWGMEFRHFDITMDENPYLRLNAPEATVIYDELGNAQISYGGDDGNIFDNTQPLAKGDKLVLTVDLNGFVPHSLNEETMEIISNPGKVTVEYSPSEAPKPTFGGVTMTGKGDWYYADIALTQGSSYAIDNLTDVAPADLYTDICFASRNDDGSFKFNAVSGNYCVMINTVTKYLKIFPGTHDAPATINEGGLWIIGEGFGRPSVNGNAAEWNVGIERDFAVAQVKKDIYQMDLTCDTEMWDNWCNFKFFGQPDWGIEFKPGTDYSISTDNEWLQIGADSGNIGFKEGASFVKGEPIYIVIDFTAGLNNGVMTVSKSVIDGIDSVSDKAVSNTGAVYNAYGVRVNSTDRHGIYIINGRKVVK